MTSRTPSIALPFQLVITSPTSKPAFLAGPSGSRSTTKTPRPPPDAGELSCRRSRLRGRRPARNSRKERYAMSTLAVLRASFSSLARELSIEKQLRCSDGLPYLEQWLRPRGEPAEGSPYGAALLEETRTAMGKAPASSAAFPHPPNEELRSKSSCSLSPWGFPPPHKAQPAKIQERRDAKSTAIRFRLSAQSAVRRQ